MACQAIFDLDFGQLDSRWCYYKRAAWYMGKEMCLKELNYFLKSKHSVLYDSIRPQFILASKSIITQHGEIDGDTECKNACGTYLQSISQHRSLRGV